MKPLKLVTVLLTLVMLLSLVLTGCGSSTQQDQISATPQDDPNKVYKLKANYYSVEKAPPGQGMQKACDLATERSSGRLQFETYYAGTLVNKNDTMAALKAGTIDIAIVEATMLAEVTVLNKVFNALLKEPPPDRHANTKAFRELIKTVPELNDELAKINMKWLSCFSLPGYNLHSVKKKVKSIDDIKGMKIEAHGDVANYINSVGGAAVELDASDYYSGLERNLVDAQMAHWPITVLYKIQELVTTHTIFGDNIDSGGLYAPPMGSLINLDTWNSLPEDLQQILVECFEEGHDYSLNLDDIMFADAIQYVQDKGDTIYYITGDLRKPFNDAMDPILNAWFKECKDAGYDGEKVYNKMLELQAKYAKENK
ncbi:MAG: TRAP transporter substrate-binding protein DctP [Peptococcaceae bacterium]|nr:TRAP transporter substrate-binding protein DctP [Peptococcaceae bacterium]